MISHVEDDETGGPAFYWINPWSGKREKLATLLWPEHPPEATAEIESMFRSMTLAWTVQPNVMGGTTSFCVITDPMGEETDPHHGGKVGR